MSQEIIVVGLDLAMNVFQVHAVDMQGQPRRAPTASPS